jgi:hypothetical protein
LNTDIHRQHIYIGEPDEDLIESLEPDQLVRVMNLRVARRQMSRALSAGLWGLRVFLFGVAGLVIYVFVAGVIRGVG